MPYRKTHAGTLSVVSDEDVRFMGQSRNLYKEGDRDEDLARLVSLYISHHVRRRGDIRNKTSTDAQSDYEILVQVIPTHFRRNTDGTTVHHLFRLRNIDAETRPNTAIVSCIKRWRNYILYMFNKERIATIIKPFKNIML